MCSSSSTSSSGSPGQTAHWSRSSAAMASLRPRRSHGHPSPPRSRLHRTTLMDQAGMGTRNLRRQPAQENLPGLAGLHAMAQRAAHAHACHSFQLQLQCPVTDGTSPHEGQADSLDRRGLGTGTGTGTVLATGRVGSVLCLGKRTPDRVDAGAAGAGDRRCRDSVVTVTLVEPSRAPWCTMRWAFRTTFANSWSSSCACSRGAHALVGCWTWLISYRWTGWPASDEADMTGGVCAAPGR